jgi:hypothetical protein
MNSADLMSRLEDRPFKPFRIHMSDGTVFDVREPGLIVVGLSSAIVPRGYSIDEEGRRIATTFRTVSLAHIVQFSDLDEPTDGQSRKKRRK